MLRTDSLTLATGDAVTWFSKLFCKSAEIGEVYSPSLIGEIVPHIFIVETEVFGNADPHGTAFRAVGTGCTGNCNIAVDDASRLETELFFLLSQRHKVLHE